MLNSRKVYISQLYSLTSSPVLTAASLRPSLRSSNHSKDRFTKSSTYSVMKVPDVSASRPTALAVSSTTPVSGLPRKEVCMVS